MSPGSLLSRRAHGAGGDGRTAARGSTCRYALALRQRGGAGDDPAVALTGLIEAGADPYYFRAAQRGRSAFRGTGRVRARALAERLAPAGRAEHLHRRQFLEVRGLAGADLLPGTLPVARPVFQQAVRGRVPARIRRNFSRRSAAISRSTSSPPRNSGASCSARRRRTSASPSRCRNRSPAKCFRRTRATARRRDARTKRSWTRTFSRRCFCARCCRTASKTALLIFEFGAFGRQSFEELSEFLDRLDPFLAALPPEFRYAVEIRNPGVSGEGLFRLPAQPQCGSRV